MVDDAINSFSPKISSPRCIKMRTCQTVVYCLEGKLPLNSASYVCPKCE